MEDERPDILEGYNYAEMIEAGSEYHCYVFPAVPHSDLLADIIHRATDVHTDVSNVTADFSKMQRFADSDYALNIRAYLLSGTGDQINAAGQQFPRRKLVLTGLDNNLALTADVKFLIRVYFQQLADFSAGNIEVVTDN